MRIRSIKPEFWEDENIAKLPPYARLLFIALWQLADRNGVFEYRPDWIQIKVFPYESKEVVDSSKLLETLVNSGFLTKYDHNGTEYCIIPTFTEHQRISGKEAESDGCFPLPDNTLHTGEALEKHPIGTREAPEKRLRRQEGKGKEQGKDTFDRFWKAYPRKVAKPVAIKAWRKAITKMETDKILEALEKQKLSDDWTKEKGKFIPYPATWLNQERWNDEPPTQAPTILVCDNCGKRQPWMLGLTLDCPHCGEGRYQNQGLPPSNSPQIPARDTLTPKIIALGDTVFEPKWEHTAAIWVYTYGEPAVIAALTRLSAKNPKPNKPLVWVDGLLRNTHASGGPQTVHTMQTSTEEDEIDPKPSGGVLKCSACGIKMSGAIERNCPCGNGRLVFSQ